jgi:alkylation response protein AidB-like acyl-CoA dehydrogenase
MDLKFSPAEEEFAGRVRDWLEEKLSGEWSSLRGIGGNADEGHFAERLAWEKELHAAGWVGLGWPEEYGGRPATPNERIVFALEYARARGPHRAGFQGTNLIGPTILAFGTDEQQRRFIPRILAADDIWCQGFSEPEAGSDLAGLRTRAVLDGNEWVLNGQKIWTSHATDSNWIYVLARTELDAPRHASLSILLLPLDTPGVELRPIRNMAGAEDFNEVFFTDARTPADMIVGERGQGWRIGQATLGFERGTGNLAYLVQFDTELQSVIDLARRQGRLGDPVLRRRLADLAIRLRVMHYTNFRNLTELMRQGTHGPQSSLLKLSWPHWHQELTALAMEIAGPASQIVGHGYELDRVQNSFLLSRAESIYGGTHQIHLNVVGERVLGLPREPRSAAGAS